jgi:hypothetical protein
MAGFETRAIWGSDPGLVSDRFRYTGVSVPLLDEEAIKRIQEGAKELEKTPFAPAEDYPAISELQSRGQVGLPSPSEIIAIQDINRLKAFEDVINQRQQPVVPSSLNTNQLNLEGTNPFEPGRQAAEKEWKRRIDAGEPEGSVFDRLMSVRDKAIEWDAMKQGALQPGRIAGIKPEPRNLNVYSGSQPGSPFDNMRTSQVEAALNQQKAISAAENNPNVFQQLLNEVGKELKGAGSGIKELGRMAADVVVPNRNKVPDYMLDVVETPEFIEAKKQLKFFGSLPGESIAPGVLSEKQSRWLVDNRRTPVVGGGAFGAVMVPERSGKAFKVQEGQSKRFLENEIEMALRTAELGLGPQVHAATLQPTGKPLSHLGSSDPEGEAYRAIVRTEAVPHRKFKDLSPEEQQFLELEKFKLNEGLYRGGVENRDSHFENILLNDATKKAVQVDSGLAREYDAFNEEHLQNRLRNIVYGLETVGLKEVARDTSELGNALIDEAWKTKTPELYAEVENFFNRSGNILMSQSRPLAKAVPPAIKGTNKIPMLKTGTAAIGVDALLGYALGQPKEQAVVDAVTAPISADAIGGIPLASIERLGPRGEFVDTRTNTVLNPQGRYTNTGIAIKGGKPIIVPRGSVAGEGNILTQGAGVLRNAANVWKQRLGALGIFGR